MNLSVNPLKERSRKFLESEKPLGFNTAQFQTEIADRFDKSIRMIFHILKHPHNLREKDLYDKLNAQTLAAITEDLLRDMKETSEYRHEKYDFRTVELAKHFFHVSTIYLMKSNLFEKDDFIEDDIKRIANRFYTLSRSILEKEQFNGKISEKDEKKLKSKLEDLKQHEYYKLNKERSLLIKKKTKASEQESKEIKRKITDINEKRNIADIDLKKRKNEIYKELEQKYDHLLGYFCHYDRLREFEYEGFQHIFSKDKGVLSYR